MMVEGIIIKGIGGFYYVKTEDGLIESRARGVFREENLKPLVGDRVKIKLSPEDNSGYIIDIMPRQRELLRPAVANITQAVIVMSVRNPNINTWLLDKFLLMSDFHGLNILICLNKFDLDENKTKEISKTYKNAGYDVIMTSIEANLGIEDLESRLKDNISVFAGPSGAGKSTLLNLINPNFKLETGKVSSKTKRGRHTTRHVELLELGDNSYVLDSPGFSSLNLDFLEDEIQVRDYFREIKKYGDRCNFLSCLHDQEPSCAIKEYVKEGIINKDRYKNYLKLLEEVRNIKRY